MNQMLAEPSPETLKEVGQMRDVYLSKSNNFMFLFKISGLPKDNFKGRTLRDLDLSDSDLSPLELTGTVFIDCITDGGTKFPVGFDRSQQLKRTTIQEISARLAAKIEPDQQIERTSVSRAPGSTPPATGPSQQLERTTIRKASNGTVPGPERKPVEQETSSLDKDLITAAANGRVGEVNRLINAGANLSATRDGDGYSALMAASEAGHDYVVQDLIQAGAMVDQTNRYSGATALMIASEAGRLGVVTRLIESGASVNEQSLDDGWTALMFASSKGDERIVSSLVNAGAKVNQGTRRDGWTALMEASREGHLDVVSRLIDLGAEVNRRATVASRLVTALTIARSFRRSDVEKFLQNSGAEEI